MTDRPRDDQFGSDDENDEGFGREAGPDFAPPGAAVPGFGPPQPAPDPARRDSPVPPSPPTPSSPMRGSSPAGAFAPPKAADRRDLPPPQPSGANKPRPTNRPPAGVITAIVAVLAAALFIIGGVAGSKIFAEPSRHTTVPRATATQFRPPPDAPAEQHEGTGFTFTTPTGWARSPKWGERNDGLIVDSEGNQITIYIFEQDEPRSRCQKELKALEVWVPGAISELPDRKIDGKLAPGGQLDGTRETYQMRCALANRSIYNISLEIKNGDVEKSTAALDEVLDSWKWKS